MKCRWKKVLYHDQTTWGWGGVLGLPADTISPCSMWCHRKGAMSRVYLDFAVGRRMILFVPAAVCKQSIKALLRGSQRTEGSWTLSWTWTCFSLAPRQQGSQPPSLPLPRFHGKDFNTLMADSLCLFSENHLGGGASPPISSQPFYKTNYCQSVVRLCSVHSDLWILITGSWSYSVTNEQLMRAQNKSQFWPNDLGPQ